jgi:hypothetical protein
VIGTHVNDVGESIPRHPRHRVLPPDGDFIQALLIRVGDVVRARKDVGPFGLQLSRHPCPRSGLGNRPSVRLTQRPVLLLQRAVSPVTNHQERFFTEDEIRPKKTTLIRLLPHKITFGFLSSHRKNRYDGNC